MLWISVKKRSFESNRKKHYLFVGFLQFHLVVPTAAWLHDSMHPIRMTFYFSKWLYDLKNLENYLGSIHTWLITCCADSYVNVCQPNIRLIWIQWTEKRYLYILKRAYVWCYVQACLRKAACLWKLLTHKFLQKYISH